ncbi:MAG: plastocyanin/azurin family copper-binding protein [Planctomycetota bacterium]
MNVRARYRFFTACLIVALGFVTPATAADATVEMFAAAFLPQTVVISAGDTVCWAWLAGDHELTSGLPTGAPGTVDEPGVLFSATVNAANPSFSATFPDTGKYHFFDANNPSQLGTILVEGDEEVFEVLVLDNVYEPNSLQIFEGDMVRWEHEPMEMLHTVTSGASSAPADNPGALFDEISSDGSPVFEFTFTDVGVVPYFCIPHETLGMSGVVFVQDRFIRGDGNRDTTITIADPVSTLDHLFGGIATDCADAHDQSSPCDLYGWSALAMRFRQSSFPSSSTTSSPASIWFSVCVRSWYSRAD